MMITLSSIAEYVGGRLEGDKTLTVTGLASMEQATHNELCFADNPSYLARLDETNAAAVLVPEDAGQFEKTVIYVENPRASFVRLYEMFYPGPVINECIHGSVVIGQNFTMGRPVELRSGVVLGDNVTLGNRVFISANVVIGNDVVMGDDVMVHPNVSILDGTVIGNRVTIHAGTVIGSDGFGFVPDGQVYRKIPHTGRVRIGDDVELGASNTIDRGTHGETVIGNGVKTDNQVHVGHNVVVGDNTLLVAQVGIAGSTLIGEHVTLAGQVGVAGHLVIGNNVTVGPQAGVLQSIDDNEVVSGLPAIEHKRWLRSQSLSAQLPELKKRLITMEKRIKKLDESGE